MTGHRAGPLEGIVVLDLCHFLAGPYATLALADLGADVVKVEDPDHADEARLVGPAFHDGQSVYFMSLNWGKRSFAVRMGHPDGRALLVDLIRRADVVIDNFRPGVMHKLALDYDQLVEVNPSIVTCSLSGFGSTGPAARRPGYDYTIQARAGVMSLTGEPDQAPGKAGISYVDHAGGMAAALAVSAALVERERTGAGRHIDLGLYDVQISMLSYLAAWSLNADFLPGRQPQGSHPSIVPAQTFQTEDDYVSIFVGNDPMWARLVDAVRDERLAEESFRTNAGRLANRQRLVGMLAETFRRECTAHWVELLVRAGVPCEAVNRIDEALADPQIAARRLVLSSSTETGTEFQHVRGPVPLNAQASALSPPKLGADTRRILREQGVCEVRIDELVASGVIVAP
jgi:crotonobetainyl-CoA:carnitine CoA-transferase CaiB-like acyl-CoA transferase